MNRSHTHPGRQFEYNPRPLACRSVDHCTSPHTTWRRAVSSLFRRWSAHARSPVIDRWADVSSSGRSPFSQYELPMVQVDTVTAYTPPSCFSGRDQTSTARTFSAEPQDEPSSPTFPADVTNAPLLSYVPLPSVPWSVPLFWTTFNQLELTCPINSNECLLILQDCSQLTDLKLTLAEVERYPLPMVSSSVEARTLHSLTLKSHCATGSLFRSLRLPQLTSLDLSLASFDEPPADIGLKSLFSRSGCSIRTLSLTNVFLLESELIFCLSTAVCSLEKFLVRNDRVCTTGTMSGRMISGNILECLTRTGSLTRPQFYKLNTLQLSPCASTDGRLAEMLASRLPTDELNFTYSFVDPSLHMRDIHYLTTVVARNLHLAHLIHEL